MAVALPGIVSHNERNVRQCASQWKECETMCITMKGMWDNVHPKKANYLKCVNLQTENWLQDDDHMRQEALCVFRCLLISTLLRSTYFTLLHVIQSRQKSIALHRSTDDFAKFDTYLLVSYVCSMWGTLKLYYPSKKPFELHRTQTLISPLPVTTTPSLILPLSYLRKSEQENRR